MTRTFGAALLRKRSFNRPLILMLLCSIFGYTSLRADNERVRSELGTEEAWMGQPIPMIVTLYAPGPFSGTANFELPELPQTTIVKIGNPVVGSESVDGETMLTQRHEFQIFTQQEGDVAVPSFTVSFEAKPDYTSQAEPVVANTQRMQFRSRRPPGTDGMPLVVTANQLQVKQTWSPANTTELKAGDILTRTIAQQADGTTAIMLSPISSEAPEEVRVYANQADVRDQVDRGDVNSLRTDILKYQFSRPGQFSIPAVEINWWDPQQEKLQTTSLPGIDVTVSAATMVSSTSPTDEQSTSPRSQAMVLVLLLMVAIAVIAVLFRGRIFEAISAFQAARTTPLHQARHDLHRACQTNQSAAALSALTNWLHLTSVALDTEVDDYLATRPSLREQFDELNRRQYGPESSIATETTSWNGNRLWQAFLEAERHREQPSTAPQLPSLNPT